MRPKAHVVLAAAALLLMTGMALSFRGSQPARAEVTAEHRLTVTGEAEIFLKPDLAYVVVGIETQGSTAAQAQQKNATMMTAVVNALRKAGVAEKDLQTSNYSLNPVYDSRPSLSGRPKVTGYTTSHQLRITVRDLEKLGDLIDEAVQAGANIVHSVTFTVVNQSAWEKQALEQAIANARDKAQAMAKAAGVTLGRPVQLSASVTPAGSGPREPVFFAKDAELAQTPIAVGQVVLRARVEMAWEI